MLFNEMEDEIETGISKSHFYAAWADKLPHIHIAKVFSKNKFGINDFIVSVTSGRL